MGIYLQLWLIVQCDCIYFVARLFQFGPEETFSWLLHPFDITFLLVCLLVCLRAFLHFLAPRNAPGPVCILPATVWNQPCLPGALVSVTERLSEPQSGSQMCWLHLGCYCLLTLLTNITSNTCAWVFTPVYTNIYNDFCVYSSVPVLY